MYQPVDLFSSSCSSCGSNGDKHCYYVCSHDYDAADAADAPPPTTTATASATATATLNQIPNSFPTRERPLPTCSRNERPVIQSVLSRSRPNSFELLFLRLLLPLSKRIEGGQLET